MNRRLIEIFFTKLVKIPCFVKTTNIQIRDLSNEKFYRTFFKGNSSHLDVFHTTKYKETFPVYFGWVGRSGQFFVWVFVEVYFGWVGWMGIFYGWVGVGIGIFYLGGGGSTFLWMGGGE